MAKRLRDKFDDKAQRQTISVPQRPRLDPRALPSWNIQPLPKRSGPPPEYVVAEDDCT